MSSTLAPTSTAAHLSPSQSSLSAYSSLSAAYASLASASAALASESAAVSGKTSSPTNYKIVGLVLALSSGLFIGSSFVFKKKGLLASQQKAAAKGVAAGESHEYLKSPMWWTGMSLMIIGEICNFVAYAFADAILVTPMGALSVVICAILSSIFLHERLSFFGKVGCFLCIVGATIIALNGPEEQAVSTITQFEDLFLAPGFLIFGSIIIGSALVLIFIVAPKWGKKNMLVYICICSIIGGLSVVSTQGLGASIITTINGNNQFKHWFMYFLMAFVVCTLLTEINYLNKALELFNTAMVTPTYYVIFTFSTLVTSVILFQGLNASVTAILTLVLGFLVICSGITLLQMSKIDPTELKGLDRRSTILLSVTSEKKTEDEKGLDAEDPGVDGLRGFGGVLGSIHRVNTARRSIATASDLQARSDMRRRRQESLILQQQRESLGLPLEEGDLEMGPNGLRRHQLWDAPMPMPEDAMDRISMHSGPSPRGETPSGQASTTLSPRSHSPGIRFQDNQIQGHEHFGYQTAPPRIEIFPNFTPSDSGPLNLRLAHKPLSGKFLDDPGSYLHLYEADVTSPTGQGRPATMSNPTAGVPSQPFLMELSVTPPGHSAPAPQTESGPDVAEVGQTGTNAEASDRIRGRTGAKSRIHIKPLSPRAKSREGQYHLPRRGGEGAPEAEELESLVGSPHGAGGPEDSDEEGPASDGTVRSSGSHEKSGSYRHA